MLWNTPNQERKGSLMSLVKLSKDSKIDEIVSIIKRDGGVIIENF